jgi:hypothetical protein
MIMKNLLQILATRNIANHLRFALSALVILWCPLPTTAQVGFSSIDAFLKSILKAEDRLSIEAKGDLNGDRLEDWAGVIH